MKRKRIFNVKNYLVLFSTGLLCSFSGLHSRNSGSAGSAIAMRASAAFKEADLLVDSIPPGGKKNKGKWEILFDGTNMDKWRGKNSESFPADGWVVKDGVLFLSHHGGGDIITRETYSSFELQLDFNLTYNANSGIKYFVGEIKNRKTGEVVMNGPEYQIIDDYNYPEVKDHRHDVGATAACYLFYPATNKKLNPAGQWNHVRIIARGSHVEHWLNGVRVLTYERGSADFLEKKAQTKFADFDKYGQLPEGHILLTDHYDTVYFRNIRIRRL